MLGVDSFLFKLFYARSVFHRCRMRGLGWVCLYYLMCVLPARDIQIDRASEKVPYTEIKRV